MKRKDYDIKTDRWNRYDMDMTLAKFCNDEPFYSHISSKINKYSTTKIKTAGVAIEDGDLNLYYNENFINNLNWMQKQGLLIHEFLHLIFNHVSSRIKKNKNGGIERAWAMACDFSINSLIDEKRLPPGGLIPGKYPEPTQQEKDSMSKEELQNFQKIASIVRGWPKGESADWYYKQIKDNWEDFEKSSNNHLLDDHSGWEELSQEEQEIMQDKFDSIMREAKDICERSNNWGSVPNHLQSIIKKLTENQINWVDVLRNFIGNSINVSKSTTIKKINKRYPYIHGGKRRKREARIAICIDQSGSVSDKDLANFFAELEALSEHCEFVVVPFDTKVVKHAIFTWRKGEKVNISRSARGGTNFSIPTKWINDSSSFDAVIFMTDGYCEKPIACKIPRSWIICKKGKLQFKTNELVIQMS